MAEQRPGIYRMLDAAGRVLYVGKAKQVKARLLSYFHAKYPEDKGARILHAASDVTWEYVSSEFAAHLAELREIRRSRPPYNVQMNRTRSTVFVGVTDGAAPKLTCSASPSREHVRYYGPLPSPGRTSRGGPGAQRSARAARLRRPDADGLRRAGRSLRRRRSRPLAPATTSAPAADPAPAW